MLDHEDFPQTLRNDGGKLFFDLTYPCFHLYYCVFTILKKKRESYGSLYFYLLLRPYSSSVNYI